MSPLNLIADGDNHVNDIYSMYKTIPYLSIQF